MTKLRGFAASREIMYKGNEQGLTLEGAKP